MLYSIFLQLLHASTSSLYKYCEDNVTCLQKNDNRPKPYTINAQIDKFDL
ncbi:hypothetical protein SAMN05216464_102512 [Mucilaginibacter pineti]|uniref:Uncharacterized protein n=1 Tax=Mucilaginibacter pineti TaxID=1391627 RepID=A0A1G6XER9_9SPHI|nr:hypothetical protein SAMN05216464_102512 [Mucilaginibacter pineti]